MDILYLVSGIAVVLFVLVDVVWTTLTFDGGGPMTRLVSRLVSSVLNWASGTHLRSIPGFHFLRAQLGPIVVLTSLFTWGLGLWLGWYLIISAMPESVVNASTRLPASDDARLYFVGFNLATLGLGDYVPTDQPARILTVLMAAMGFFVSTLSISYIMPVVSAVLDQRKVSLLIRRLGDNPSEIVAQGFDGNSFDPLITELRSVIPSLVVMDQQHAAYPVLHHFRAGSPDSAFPVGLATLEEILNLLEHGVTHEVAPSVFVFRQLRLGLSAYLEAVHKTGISSSAEPPPPPRRRPLAEVGVPMASEKHFHSAIEAASGRRRAHLGYLRADGWDWSDIDPEADVEEPSEKD